MNKSEILEILKDWNLWEKPLEEGISRPEYVGKMREQIASGQVLIVTGARRSGKSFLMRQLASSLCLDGLEKERTLFVNFEDPRWIGADALLLDEIFHAYLEFVRPEGKPYLFLDEIQEVEGWEKWVRSMHELGKATIVLSGSNAKLLSRELGTVLTGRHVDVTVYPLSFSEFLSFKGMDASSDRLGGYMREYVERGAFPALVVSGTSVSEWLLSYYDDLLEKDLIRRFKVRKTEELKALLRFYMGNIAKSTTFHAAGKFLGISSDTAEKFMTYFEQSYLLFPIRRFSPSFKGQQKSPRKIYALDTALARVTGFRVGEDFGRMAENVVYLELLREKMQYPEREYFYWKDERAGRDGDEVDFVVKNGSNIVEILQVCMGEFQGDVRRRELRAMRKAAERLHPGKLTVVTEEYSGIESFPYGSIEFVPIEKWLVRSK